ncbi:MAG: flippase [Chitinophagaceae bacterium]|nr:flippase [Chitinophagaceae bacterium]
MSLRRNLINNFVLTASTVVFPLITFPYITRVLSPENFGAISFADAFTQYFIIFSTIGIPVYGIREIAKVKDNPARYSILVKELVLIQLILSFIFSATFIVLYFLLPSLRINFSLVKIGCIYIICSSFLIEWFYQGMEKFAYITRRAIIVKAASVIAILIFIKQPDDYILYSFILVMAPFLNACINFHNFIRRYYISSNDRINLKQHLKPLLVLFGISVSVSIYSLMDTIILGLFTDTRNVGIYSVPLRLVKIFWTIVVGAGVVIIPRMAGYFAAKDMRSIGNLLTRSSNLVFLLCFPFCFFCLVFPKEILQVISGNKYLDATIALQVMSVVPLIVGLCNVFGSQFLLPLGEERRILHATILGLVISLSANFLLIPYLQFIGAAITCVLSETAVCLYVYLCSRKHIKAVFDHRLLVHIFLTIAICASAGIMLRNHLYNLPLLLTVFAIYLITFGVLQVVLFRNSFIFSLLKLKKA